MNIVETASTKIRGEQAIVFPLKYNGGGGYIFDQNDHMILQMRGWVSAGIATLPPRFSKLICENLGTKSASEGEKTEGIVQA